MHSLHAASRFLPMVSSGFCTTELQHTIISFLRCAPKRRPFPRNPRLGATFPVLQAWRASPAHCLLSLSPNQIPLGLYPPPALASIKPPPIIHAAINWVKRQLPYLDPKDLLPISIEISKLAIVCGNQSTPSLMVAECHRADGTFGIVRV